MTDTSSCEYQMKLLQKRYGSEYNISQSSTSLNHPNEYEYILIPKDNPSLLLATLFPMYKTRYKYKLTFHTSSNSSSEDIIENVSYQDLYKITFNRSNGSTPQQQTKIYKRNEMFEEQLEKLIEEIRYDREMKATTSKKNVRR